MYKNKKGNEKESKITTKGYMVAKNIKRRQMMW
jgi:hypothetical protein